MQVQAVARVSLAVIEALTRRVGERGASSTASSIRCGHTSLLRIYRRRWWAGMVELEYMVERMVFIAVPDQMDPIQFHRMIGFRLNKI